MKSFKYRLYPTRKQEQLLINTLNTCRHTYNDALEQRKEAYQNTQKTLTYNQQANNLAKNKNHYQSQVYSQVLQNVLKRLDKSYKRFFDRCKQGTKKAGFPRFKSFNRYRSFTYPQLGFRITSNNKRVELSKIGCVKMVYSRPILGDIKTCQVVRDVDHWYVIFACDIEQEFIIHSNPGSVVGIDVGIKTLCALSTGETIENPKFLKKTEHSLARTQRTFSRKPTKTSNRRNKQRIKVARLHRKIRFQRDDYLHKASSCLAKSFETIVFEDLTVSNMVKNHKLAKSISDCSWNKLVQYTTYKAESAGGKVELVNPKNTSQLCSSCGSMVRKDLSVRIHKCPCCGDVEDRDLNASKNILNRYTVGLAGINALGEQSSTLLEMAGQECSVIRESVGL